MRRVVWWIIVCFVLFTSLSGLWNGFQDWAHSKNLGERLVTVAVIIYGIGGATLVFTMIWNRKWIMIPLFIWAIAIAFAAIAAPWVYSDEAKWISTIASGIFVIVLLTLIALRVRTEASSW